MAQFDKKLFRLNGTNASTGTASAAATGVVTLNAYTGVITTDALNNRITLTNSKVGAATGVVASLTEATAGVFIGRIVIAANTIDFYFRDAAGVQVLGVAGKLSFVLLNPDS